MLSTHRSAAHTVRPRLGVEQLEDRVVMTASPAEPVLLVIANQDFWYQDYHDTRVALEAAGLDVVVAAASTDLAVPHGGSGQGADGGLVQPDIALAEVSAANYSAIAFVGGWGASSYQYAFEGTYHNAAYNGTQEGKQIVNEVIDEFFRQDKHIAGICYGVSALAYARVDGVSLLAGREVTGWNGAAPAADNYQSSRQQIEANGAHMRATGMVGDPTTAADDVIVDGRIITAEDYRSATYFGQVLAREVLAAAEPQVVEQKPVLLVIANRDFHYREYGETRDALEQAGIRVVVAAATTDLAIPHDGSVPPGRVGEVAPDLALADADAADYSAIVFVGGWGAASYQYAYQGTYDNAAYNGSAEVRTAANQLINDFVAQDKYVAAICNGVSVLAWARVDGVSPLDGRTVSAWAGTLGSADGGQYRLTRADIVANGGIMVPSQSLGDPWTAADDVYVDGKIITAENYDSAYAFGETIARQLG